MTATTTAPVDRSTLRLSEVARHVVIPEGIVDTLWFEVEERCREFGDTFDVWQDGLGQVTLGIREDGMWAATVGGITYSIPRQVAKTFIVGRIVIALCSLFPNLTVLWTAHRIRTATNTFQKLKGVCMRPSVRPYIEPGRNMGTAIRDANGEQEIPFANGSRILFGAREQGFGRGFDEVDIIVFDEAQILTDKALEDMVAATNQSRWEFGALLFYMGTPPRPNVDPGEVFDGRRTEALEHKKAAGAPDFGEPLAVGDALYVECSADPDTGSADGPDLDDPEQVARANPSYPHRTPPVAVRRLRKNLPSDEGWMREGLGIWDPKLTSNIIDPQSWSAVADPASLPTERITLAIDVAPDRSVAAVSVAGLRPDDLWHVSLDEHRAGADWTIGWVKQRAERRKLHAVVVDELAGLTETRHKRHYLKGTDIEVTLAASEGRDMAKAWATYYDSVTSATVRHTDQPQVNVALSQAGTRDLQGGRALSKKTSTSDITPLTSQTLALWGAQRDDVKRPGKRERRKVVVR